MKTITGKVITVIDNTQGKSVVVETSPAVEAKDGKPAVQAKRMNLQTNDHELLSEISKSGQAVTITVTVE